MKVAWIAGGAAAAAAAVAVSLRLILRDGAEEEGERADGYRSGVAAVALEGAVAVPPVSTGWRSAIESVAGRYEAVPGFAVFNDGDPANSWIEAEPRFPVEVTLSFDGRALHEIEAVELDCAGALARDPTSLPNEVRLRLSEWSATDGFRDGATARLARGESLLRFRLAKPERARFVRLEIASNHGDAQALAIGEVRILSRKVPPGADFAVNVAGPEYPGEGTAHLLTGMVREGTGPAFDPPWLGRPATSLPVEIDIRPFRNLAVLLEAVVLDTRLGKRSLAGCAPKAVEVLIDRGEGGEPVSAARLDVPSPEGAHVFRIAPEGRGIPCGRVRLVVRELQGGPEAERCALREVALYGRFREAPAAPSPLAPLDPRTQDVEVNDRLESPQRVGLDPAGDLVLRGALDHEADVDTYSFVVAPGDTGSYSVVLSKADEVDTWFSVAGPDPDAVEPGIAAATGPPPLIAVVDDARHPAQEAIGGVKPPSAGEYFVMVAGRPGFRPAAYTLTVRRR